MSGLQLVLKWNGSDRNWFWWQQSPFKNRHPQRRAKRRDHVCSWNYSCCLIHSYPHQRLLRETTIWNYIWLPCHWSHPGGFREKRAEAEGNISKNYWVSKKYTNSCYKYKESAAEIFATTTAPVSSPGGHTPHCQQINKFHGKLCNLQDLATCP